MLEDSERNLWCGDQSRGLVEFRPDGRTLRFTHEDGLPSLAIRALFEDRENNVWVGTHGGGMTRFRHRAAYLFHEASNSDETQIDTVAATAAGRLLLATYEGGLIQFDAASMRFGAFPQYRGNSRLAAHSRVLTALEDHAGTIWTNLSGMGLFRIRAHSPKTHESSVEEQSSRELEGKTIFEDSRGTLWVGTYFGIARQESGEFEFYRSESGLPQGLISAIGEDQDGGIWVGGAAGFFTGRMEGLKSSYHLERTSTAQSPRCSAPGTARLDRPRKRRLGSPLERNASPLWGQPRAATGEDYECHRRRRAPPMARDFSRRTVVCPHRIA